MVSLSMYKRTDGLLKLNGKTERALGKKGMKLEVVSKKWLQ